MNDVLREQIQLNTKEVVVNVDNDHMKASIVLNGIGSDEAYTYEEIADKLSQAGVRTGINEARIREVILNKLYDIEIVVAEGKSAVNGTDGYYNFFFDSEYERDNKPTLREDGSVDYFNVKLFEKVNKDDKLAEYIEPTKGEFGYDIFGKLLVPKPGRPGPKLRGKGFTVSEDGKSYYAQLSGKVEYRNYDLNVSNVYNVSGDVDVGTGSIDFNGDVEINGSVRGSVKIHAMGNIYIGGYVEDADIWSGQDIIIQDGVNAGENGRIEAMGNISARFFENAHIISHSDIKCDYMLNTTALAYGGIYLEGKRGSVIGGDVTGVIKDWDSRWYADAEYADYLVEDYNIRKFLKKKLYSAGVSKIEIERASDRVKVILYTAKPGVVIGKGGAEIEVTKKELSKLTDKKVLVDIKEIKRPDRDAQLVAENIAQQLENRVAFRRAMKSCIGRTMKTGAKGIKTAVSGRLGGADIARTEFYSEGTIPLQTLRADIDYGFAEADTTYGKVGVKVWIYKGEVLPTKGNKEGSDK